ncbi:hypothetical protein EDD53_0186 [Pacificibacter maritimus]|uniref:SpoIIAA-like protein n=1 Tax=Pacificibacter maritimus TaxID=762213 RepID=A0A3N4UKV3_9RHOB|nr:hypothetical protein [Pacificibacter maritimus]RPE71073.1 hypothetical protein EDD53_0186 [Pacificibacter maritimus]
MLRRVDIYHDLKISILTLSGNMTASAGADLISSYTYRPDFSASYPTLVDARELTDFDSRYLEVYRSFLSINKSFDRFDEDSKVMILVSCEAIYGMMRMADQVVDSMSNFHHDVTLDEAHALAWLGRTEPTVEAIHVKGQSLSSSVTIQQA